MKLSGLAVMFVFALTFATMAQCSCSAKQPAVTAAAPAAVDKPDLVSDTYPGLFSEGLSRATLSDLPDGIVLKAGDVSVTQKVLDAEIDKSPEGVRDQLRKNAFFVLEQMATRRLLSREAKAALARDGTDVAKLPEKELFQAFFSTLTAKAKVTEAETADFYAKNKEMVGDRKFENVKNAISKHLLQQKQQEIISRHVQTLGQRTTILLAAPWVKRQAKLARDNPVDKARASGRPSLVDFGSKGCIPCDKLAPILETLKTKYEGKANVLFVSVREEQILATRYGIRSIPVQIFFDAGGKEVFRHTGFWPQEELENKLAEAGVK